MSQTYGNINIRWNQYSCTYMVACKEEWVTVCKSVHYVQGCIMLLGIGIKPLCLWCIWSVSPSFAFAALSLCGYNPNLMTHICHLSVLKMFSLSPTLFVSYIHVCCLTGTQVQIIKFSHSSQVSLFLSLALTHTCSHRPLLLVVRVAFTAEKTGSLNVNQNGNMGHLAWGHPMVSLILVIRGTEGKHCAGWSKHRAAHVALCYVNVRTPDDSFVNAYNMCGCTGFYMTVTRLNY